MTFKEYVEACNKLLQENPEIGKYPAVQWDGVPPYEGGNIRIAEQPIIGFIESDYGEFFISKSDYDKDASLEECDMRFDFFHLDDAVCIGHVYNPPFFE